MLGTGAEIVYVPLVLGGLFCLWSIFGDEAIVDSDICPSEIHFGLLDSEKRQ